MKSKIRIKSKALACAEEWRGHPRGRAFLPQKLPAMARAWPLHQPARLPPPTSFPRFASSPYPPRPHTGQALAISKAPPNYPLLPTG